MAKLTLTDIASGYSSVSALDNNFASIEAAIEKTLSRDGTSPNQMEASLDMNSNRILNLPDALNSSEPVTLGMLEAYGDDAGALALRADLASEESGKGMDLVANGIKVFSVASYGAIGDYNPAVETDGQVATVATDNRAAFLAAVADIEAAGGGVLYVPAGDYYLSNHLSVTDVSNFYLWVSPAATIRTTKYTSVGGTIAIGHSDPDAPIENVGVFGGGTIRNFRPDHSVISAWVTLTAYEVGDYVLSTDDNGDTRAYYCKVAGTSGATGPSVINGDETDGTVQWQDADNDNAIGITGKGVYVHGMNIPECSGKFITVQTPQWENVWITHNRCGTNNDNGIELKGQVGSSGQEDYFGKNGNVIGNVIESCGYEGIEVEQSSFGNNLNENCSVIDNIVHISGTRSACSGIRINRCKNPVVRGNKVLQSSSNSYHIRLCENVQGDIHSENAAANGVHLQDNTGFSFSSVVITDCNTDEGTAYGVNLNGDLGGGFIGQLRVTGSDHTYGFRETGSGANSVVVVSQAFIENGVGGAGTKYNGKMPELLQPLTGSYTPALTFGGAAVGMTYSTQQGSYVLQGDICTVIVNIVLSAKGSSTGTAAISLPFVAHASAGSQVCIPYLGDIAFADYPNATVTQNTDSLVLRETATTAANAPITDADFENASLVRFTFTYRIKTPYS